MWVFLLCHVALTDDPSHLFFFFSVIAESKEAHVVRTFYLQGKVIADQVFRQRIADCKPEQWPEELKM